MSFFFLLYLVGSLPTLLFYLVPSLAMAPAAAAAIAKFTSWIILWIWTSSFLSLLPQMVVFITDTKQNLWAFGDDSFLFHSWTQLLVCIFSQVLCEALSVACNFLAVFTGKGGIGDKKVAKKKNLSRRLSGRRTTWLTVNTPTSREEVQLDPAAHPVIAREHQILYYRLELIGDSLLVYLSPFLSLCLSVCVWFSSPLWCISSLNLVSTPQAFYSKVLCEGQEDWLARTLQSCNL